jgi:hypothetical protein
MRWVTSRADRTAVVVASSPQMACRICAGLDGEIWKLAAGLTCHLGPRESVTV